MVKQDLFQRMKQPTSLQIRYMEELRRRPLKRGTIRDIANACEVSHAAVSRFFRTAIEAGYLTDEYEFTKDGLEWLNVYLENRNGLYRYLESIGVPKATLEENVSAILENMSADAIALLLDSWKKTVIREMEPGAQPGSIAGDLEKLLGRGIFPVHFRVLQAASRGSIRGADAVGGALSMADAGFEKPALLRISAKGANLELRICEMRQWSRVTRQWMSGELNSLKYEEYGRYHTARIRDGVAYISLNYCRYKISGGRITIVIPIVAGCSVGTRYMPESPAVIVLWL